MKTAILHRPVESTTQSGQLDYYISGKIFSIIGNLLDKVKVQWRERSNYSKQWPDGIHFINASWLLD